MRISTHPCISSIVSNVWDVHSEEAMNPFQAFRGRVRTLPVLTLHPSDADNSPQEATRAYESLNVLERGVLVLTRAVLGNRRTRTAFIFYAISLHLLTAFTLYECATSSGSQLQRQPSPYGS